MVIFYFSIYPSSQPPGPQTPIGNNTGSLPDLSNVHFPSPLHIPLDQEDHSSSTQYSNVSYKFINDFVSFIFSLPIWDNFIVTIFFTKFFKRVTHIIYSISL